MAIEWSPKPPLSQVGPVTVEPGTMNRGTLRAGMANIPVLAFSDGTVLTEPSNPLLNEKLTALGLL